MSSKKIRKLLMEKNCTSYACRESFVKIIDVLAKAIK